MSMQIEMRDALITELYEKACHDSQIIFLTNDYGAPSLDIFRSELSEQFLNMAIAEQNMISVAAGLAIQGKKVFVYSIASFLTLRCLEQIKIDICSMKLPVTLMGVGTGYGYSTDGPTHHATEDVAIMRAIGNMNILSPGDYMAAKACVSIALKTDSPLYIRLDRGKYPVVNPHGISKNGFDLLFPGGTVCIISTGSMSHMATKIAENLKEKGILISVLNILRLKPLSRELIEILSKYSSLVTLEEHLNCGGIGGSIAEFLADNEIFCQLRRLAVTDEVVYAYGNREDLQRQRGLDLDSVTQVVLDLLKREKK